MHGQWNTLKAVITVGFHKMRGISWLAENFRVHGGISRTTGDRYDRRSEELGIDIHKIVTIVKK
jgi:hypothetical protein